MSQTSTTKPPKNVDRPPLEQTPAPLPARRLLGEASPSAHPPLKSPQSSSSKFPTYDWSTPPESLKIAWRKILICDLAWGDRRSIDFASNCNTSTYIASTYRVCEQIPQMWPGRVPANSLQVTWRAVIGEASTLPPTAMTPPTVRRFLSGGELSGPAGGIPRLVVFVY